MAKKKKDSSDSAATPDLDFEQALAELEGIVRRLEQGGNSLEEALDEYGTAIGLMKHCHLKLEKAERRVELLSGVDSEGNPVSVPMETSSENDSLDAKRQSRSAKRSAKKKDAPDEEAGLF